jgi:hypothetical protein
MNQNTFKKMAKKKKRKVVRKSSKSKSQPKREPKATGPQFMVQVNDTRVIRKDVLESLREVILFMQGYEKFKGIQNEKISMISKLKEDIKEMHSLIDNKVRKLLPKGKLATLNPIQPVEVKHTVEHHVSQPVVAQAAPMEHHQMSAVPAQSQPVAVAPKPSATSELDVLEAQLKEIEGQLKGM